jgi:hypothetical protein
MRTTTDALLSLQRHVAAALPSFSEVLTEIEREAPARPFAVVSANGDASTAGTVNTPWMTMPCTVYAYVTGSTAKEARQAVEDAQEALWQALMGPDGRQRIPLWDYAGKPCTQRVAITGARGGTFTVALGGQTSDPLPQLAQPIDVREAVEQLVGVPGPVVFGRAGGPWGVRFDGELRGQNFPELTVDTSGLVLHPLAEVIEATVDVLAVGDPAPWLPDRSRLNLEQVILNSLRDPADPTLRTATASIRLTWGRRGDVPSAEMTLNGITARGR